VGCASAYYLAKSGARVVLIEKGQVNQGASGQNAGSLHFQLEHRLIAHHKQLTHELADYVSFTKTAIRQWRNIETELGCHLELTMKGGLMVAETAEELELLRLKSAIERNAGLDIELLGGDETRTIAPYLGNSVQAALYCAHEGHCNPRLLTPAYARKAQEHGAVFLTGAPVSALRRRERKWEVDYSRGTSADQKIIADALQADNVLNAAGAWSGDVSAMAGFCLPVIPIGLTMNVTEPVSPFIPHLVQHVGRKLSMKQVHDGNVLIGGGWNAVLQYERGRWLADTSPLIKPESVRSNLQVASEVVPAVSDLHLLRSWTGTTCITPDELPVLGEIPEAPGLFAATGGPGFTFGPAYAQIISNLILSGDRSSLPPAYAPERFSHINMFMG